MPEEFATAAIVSTTVNRQCQDVILNLHGQIICNMEKISYIDKEVIV